MSGSHNRESERTRFRIDLSPYQRSLGAWSDQFNALYDEYYAHLIGTALPFTAGDEAQTVRPTDFEWRWLNDLLHHRLGASSEFKLSANLRSPRQIATLVNRVWDLYDELDEKDQLRVALKQKRYAEAYLVLQQLPTPDPGAEAECLVALERFAEAAAKFRDAGNLKSALDCYRRVPDFDNAAALIGQLGTHSAAGSYEWLLRLRQLVQERPENFNRIMLEPEKKVLEQLLEQALGVARKKPSLKKKAAASKPPARKAAKKAASRSNF
ncbi:MAG: hypothetical protein K2X03_14400 [Bryobacteraceae bacterium]|nr:hypothetical protein [Bryobacteraceae bacterium]